MWATPAWLNAMFRCERGGFMHRPEAFLSLIIQGGVDRAPSIAPQALHLYRMERQPARATMKSGNGCEAGRPQRLSGFALGL